MTRSRQLAAVAAVLVLAAAVVAVLALPRLSNDGPAREASQEAGTAQEVARTEPGATSEGIKVHGSWVIEIRDPDGTLVAHREIENALTGGATLSSFLARQDTVGLWYVRVAAISNHPCLDSGSARVECRIIESASTNTQSWIFETLTVDAPTSGTDADSLVLTGTATAQIDGEIGAVSTHVYSCDPTVAPASDCQGSGSANIMTS